MHMRRKAVCFEIFLLLLWTAALASAALTSKDCLDCHTDPSIVPNPINSAALDKSIHGDLDCADCHTDVIDAPHRSAERRSGALSSGAVPTARHEKKPAKVSCFVCHNDKEAQAAGSFHQTILGKDSKKAPDCLLCHGQAHEMMPSSSYESPVSAGHIALTCGKCHADPAFIQEHKMDIPPAFLERYAKLTHVKQGMKHLTTAAPSQTATLPPPPEEENCMLCHGDSSFKHYVDGAVYKTSAHAGNRCTSCHADAVGTPHPKKLSPVNCSQCHRIETEIYLKSDHGKAIASGVSQAASCKSCHGDTHTILNSRDPNSPVHRAHIPETCARCHDDPKLMSHFRLAEPYPFDSYSKSVHGIAHGEGKASAAVCTDCHGSHDLHGKLNTESKIYKLSVPKTCGRCHENVLKTYQISVHGKAVQDGITDAPVCTDCHGEHQVQGPKDMASPVSPAHIVETCSRCHGSERIVTRYHLPSNRVETYLKSYHGLARQAGSMVAANCASCHGFHDVLPSSDPRSSVNPNNLAMTCGKCHPGAGPHLSEARVHETSSASGEPILNFVRRFYIGLIIFLIGFMVLHNGLDFLRKLIWGPGEGGHLAEERMSFNERIQHFFLIISFTGLGYTGMCHRFPREVWALPLMGLEGGSDIRRFLHRGFAVVFVGLALYHALWAIFNKRGKDELKKLKPGVQDAKEAGGLIGYNAGWVKKKPVRTGKYSYIEKMEYWALVWGTVIMTATGLVLTFENWTLKYFPKWIADLALTIHFFEALLAILAILVWHFYWTIFDPDVYPMSWVWLTGFVRRKKSGRDDGNKDSP